MIKKAAMSAAAILSLMSGSSFAAPCTGNFILVANSYTFDMRLDNSFNGITGYLIQTQSPNGYWAPDSIVQGTCDGIRMNLQRHTSSGFQFYTFFDQNGQWSGSFSAPNESGRFSAVATPR